MNNKDPYHNYIKHSLQVPHPHKKATRRYFHGLAKRVGSNIVWILFCLAIVLIPIQWWQS